MLTTTMTDRGRQAVQLITATRKWRATIPKPIADAEAEVTARLEQIETVGRAAEGLGAATHDALTAGKDPLTDKAVQRALDALQLTKTSAWQSARMQAHGPLEKAVAAHADDLVASWAKVHAKHAATLVDAYKALGDVDLDDPRAVLDRGGDAAAHWHAAKEASAVIDQITAQWKTLAAWKNVHVRYPALLHAPGMRLGPWQQLPPKVNAWMLTKTVGNLTLPTITEYADAAARLEAEQAQVNAADAEDRRKRNPYAFGVVDA